MEFFLHKNVTPDGLTAAGFSHQYRNKYTLRKNLYKDSIYIIIYIDLDEPKEAIEWTLIKPPVTIHFTTIQISAEI